ncbi:MAG: DUF839 domain-containing protein [Akkermansiaceae bacterium]|nr:DUF839 domain-containing protein [Akkermansiaceae bacterium]
MKSTSIIALASLSLASILHAQGIKTTESAYLLATPSSNFTFEPIVTVGDRLPITPGTAPTGATDFAFCGIPDAMGIYKDRVSGQNILFVAHETNSATNTAPFPGLTRYKGAFVSRFVMANDGGVVNGSVAHKELFLENTQAAGVLGTRPPQEGDAAGFTRFCSGSFAGPEQGMDRPLFLTNEESSGGTYDAAGSQTVVIADGKMYTAPDLGRVARETTMVQPRRDALSVVISTEDEGSPSYIYMYVGQKQRRSANVLDKNGLTNGKIYVLAGRDAQHNEGTFTSGSLPTKWVEIPNAATLNSADLANAADAQGGFGFVRVEDSEFDPAQPTRSMFIATTGGGLSNRLGRLYEVTMNPTDPTANGTLNVVYNADTIVYPAGSFSGGAVGSLVDPDGAGPLTAPGSFGIFTQGTIGTTDYPVSIDNIAVSKDFIVVCEDRNGPADAVFANFRPQRRCMDSRS